MIDIIVRGGLMMIPILLGSVLALTIIIERFWMLQRDSILPQGFLIRIDNLLKSGQHPQALDACLANDSPMARIMAAGLQVPDGTRQEIRESLEMAGKREVVSLSRWVGALGGIAATEPLMGLLGTVLGMIEAFRMVETTKLVGDPSVVAQGVWQALITTAAGLIIAIPAFAFYRYFKARVYGLTVDMEQTAHAMLLQMSKVRQPGATEPAPAQEPGS